VKPHITETGAGAILFKRNKDTLEFLLLQSFAGNWNFPKGHLESESIIDCAKREVLEETANTVEFLDNFHEKITYTCEFPKEVSTKTIHFFLAESTQPIVLNPKEHANFTWATLEKSSELLKHDLQKNILAKAKQFLEKKK